MTDRTGDGLRAKLIEFDSFLNEPPAYEDKTMVRDYRHSAYAKWSSLCADIVRTIDTRAPARDGAEGAEPDRVRVWDENRGAYFLQDAPPKPAHDAVREALRAAKAAMIRTRTASIAGCEEGYGKPQLWADELFASHGDLTKAIALCADAETALAVPVPSPDGAGELPPTKSRSAPSEVVGANHAGPGREEETRPPSSPSPAVAAEPAVRDTNMFSRLAHEPLAVIPEGCSAPLEIRTAAEIEFDRKAAKVASPTVRGDREAALRLLQASSCFRGEVCVSLPCACAESLADLSLPVQPGAGEREAARILRGWAKAYRDSPEHRFPSDPNAEFFPVDLENAADLLAPSSQAPHSSSEGGR